MKKRPIKQTAYKHIDNLFSQEDYEVIPYTEVSKREEPIDIFPYRSNIAHQALLITIEMVKETGLILLGVIKIGRLGLSYLITSMSTSLSKKRRLRDIERLKAEEYRHSTPLPKSKPTKRKVVVTFEDW